MINVPSSLASSVSRPRRSTLIPLSSLSSPCLLLPGVGGALCHLVYMVPLGGCNGIFNQPHARLYLSRFVAIVSVISSPYTTRH